MKKKLIFNPMDFRPNDSNNLPHLQMKPTPLENIIKFQEIQSRLTKYPYLSREALPGTADALVFQKLKTCQRIPPRSIYENFYHWYITISQFAQREIESWKKNINIEQDDKLIEQSLTLIESIKQTGVKIVSETPVEYIMNIFVKAPVEDNITKIKNKLQITGPVQIGEQLKISYKSYQQRVKEYVDGSNQLRVIFKLKHSSCQKFQELVLKWAQVQNIQVRKLMKQKRMSINQY